jgi:hypothetical protein
MQEYLILFSGPLYKSLLNCPALNLTLVVCKECVWFYMVFCIVLELHAIIFSKLFNLQPYWNISLLCQGSCINDDTWTWLLMIMVQARSGQGCRHTGEGPQGVLIFQWRVVQGDYSTSYFRELQVLISPPIVFSLFVHVPFTLCQVFQCLGLPSTGKV